MGKNKTLVHNRPLFQTRASLFFSSLKCKQSSYFVEIGGSFAQPWARPATLNHSLLSGAQTSPPAKEGSGSSSAGWGRRRSHSVPVPSATRVHISRRHGDAYSAWRPPEDLARSSVILHKLAPCERHRRAPQNIEKMSQAELWKKKERAIYCKPIISSHLLGSRHLSFSLFPFSVSDRSVNLLKMKPFLSPLLQRNGRFISSIRLNFAEPRQSLRRILSSQQRSRGKSLCAVVKNRTFTHCFSRFHIITLTFIELQHFFDGWKRENQLLSRFCQILSKMMSQNAAGNNQYSRLFPVYYTINFTGCILKRFCYHRASQRREASCFARTLSRS